MSDEALIGNAEQYFKSLGANAPYVGIALLKILSLERRQNLQDGERLKVLASIEDKVSAWMTGATVTPPVKTVFSSPANPIS